MKILICSVGGSDVPIVKALRHHRPDRVIFVCSKDDPATSRPGSHTMVEKAGLVCGARRESTASPPTRPNIATQAEMSDEAWKILRVPADDLPTILDQIQDELRALPAEAQISADYTGGTKSMTAGLAMAALLDRRVGVSLVTGPRLDLARVKSGMEGVRTIAMDVARQRLDLALAERAWKRYAYGEAQNVLSAVSDRTPELERALLLSRAFACWDAFAHPEAFALLQGMSRAAHLDPTWLPNLAKLANRGRVSKTQLEGLRVWDLHLSAQRRLTAGQADLAALLAYRVVEGIGQWALRVRHGVDPGGLTGEQSERLEGLWTRAHDGRRVMGMEHCWRSLDRLKDKVFEAVACETVGVRRRLQEIRNESRLTHGHRSVSREEAEEALALVARHWVPAFKRAAEAARLRLHAQLPAQFLE